LGRNVIHVGHGKVGNASIQVIERRLDSDGRPLEGSASDGRFMITVAGTIDGNAQVSLGDRLQTIPMLRAEEYQLWLPGLRDDPYRRLHDDHWYGPSIRFRLGSHNYQHGHRS
jgi:starvation-inducible outer membrane lipoprotein